MNQNYSERHVRQIRKRRLRRKKVLGGICVTTIMATAILLVINVFGGYVYDERPKDINAAVIKSSDQSQDTTEVSTMPEETLPPPSVGDGTQSTIQGYDYSKPVPDAEAVDNSFFDDAVFIGDSRTEGFILYSGLGNTTSYVHKGLMVNTVLTDLVIKMDGTKVSVIDALKRTTFSKIYIMLGINEAGWAYSSKFIESYGKAIDAIKEINPSADIYVQAILPVSNKVSSTHSYLNNKKLEEYNSLIQKMTQEKEIYYVDAASAVAGEDGSLPEDAASDGIHLKKDYCTIWLDYLKTHTVSQ